ncbi:hypothetical protein FRC08_007186 [Ceratobasidium sp. 394]|nr:hypothetical protein FRC08_007186 [Ceratobasidium sp. 394]
MASYNPYAPMHGDPSSVYPRVYEFLPLPYDPSTFYSSCPAPQSRAWSAYTGAYFAPDSAYAHWNAAGPVPRVPHAVYGPDRPIEGRPRARPRRPSVHAQTAAARWPRPRLEDAGQMVVKSRRRGRARGSSVSSVNSLLPRVRTIHNHRLEGSSPVELCTPPLGQVPRPNLFAQTSASRSSRPTGPPFVVPRSKLPTTLSRAWRRLWH